MNEFKAGELYLDFEVRTESLVTGLRRVETLSARSAQVSSNAFVKNFGAQKVGKKVGSDLSKGLKAASKGLGVAGQVAGAGITAAEKVFEVTKTALKAAAEIDQLSTQLGTSASQFQELRFAAQQFGLEGNEIVGVLDNMNQGVGEFINTGGGSASGAFRALGLSTDIASGKISGTISIFDAVVDKLEGVKNAQQRGALAAQIFGKENGTKLNTLLNQGSGGIQKMREEAKRLGIVLDDIDIKNATEAYGALEKLGTTLKANLNRAIVQATPANHRIHQQIDRTGPTPV